MSFMRWIACRWIPPWLRADASYRIYLSFLDSLAKQGNMETDDEFRRKVESAARDVGVKLAGEVRDAFKFGSAIGDAVDAWRIGCNTAGVKYRMEKKGGKYVFHHPKCPMHKYFTSRGIIPCKSVCLPMVIAIAQSVCPECEVEIVRDGDMKSTCIKALSLKAPRIPPTKGED